jgi:hypothetical protein
MPLVNRVESVKPGTRVETLAYGAGLCGVVGTLYIMQTCWVFVGLCNYIFLLAVQNQCVVEYNTRHPQSQSLSNRELHHRVALFSSVILTIFSILPLASLSTPLISGAITGVIIFLDVAVV